MATPPGGQKRRQRHLSAGQKDRARNHCPFTYRPQPAASCTGLTKRDDDDDVELNVLGCRVDILGRNCDQSVYKHGSMLLNVS